VSKAELELGNRPSVENQNLHALSTEKKVSFFDALCECLLFHIPEQSAHSRKAVGVQHCLKHDKATL